jgi:hypothetical protein
MTGAVTNVPVRLRAVFEGWLDSIVMAVKVEVPAVDGLTHLVRAAVLVVSSPPQVTLVTRP